MTATDSAATCSPLPADVTHQYRLMFCANCRGLSKRVEFRAAEAGAAIELALADSALRTVDIWQDGEFLCRLSRHQKHTRTHRGTNDGQ